MPRKSRKKSSSSNTGAILGLIGGLFFILIIGGLVAFLFLGGQGGDDDNKRSRRTAANDLSVNDYLENANTLRGNAYRVEGRVEDTLRYTPDRGRLISLDVKSTSGSAPIPVLVPAEFNHIDIEKGAGFTMVVEVGRNGLLVASDIKKG